MQKKDSINEKSSIGVWVISGLLVIIMLGLFFVLQAWASFFSDDIMPLFNETQEPAQLSKPENVCSNLEKIEDGSLVLHPIITQQKIEVESGFPGGMMIMEGNTTRVRGFDEEGVTCQLDAEICYPGFFCIPIEVLLPVSYEDWEQWIQN